MQLWPPVNCDSSGRFHACRSSTALRHWVRHLRLSGNCFPPPGHFRDRSQRPLRKHQLAPQSRRLFPHVKTRRTRTRPDGNSGAMFSPFGCNLFTVASQKMRWHKKLFLNLLKIIRLEQVRKIITRESCGISSGHSITPFVCWLLRAL